MPARERVYRRLRHADVALDADDDDLRGGSGGEVMTKRGPHAEGGLVDFLDGGGEVELRAGWAEAGGVLGGGVDGDREDGGGAEELLGGEDSRGWLLGAGWVRRGVFTSCRIPIPLGGTSLGCRRCYGLLDRIWNGDWWRRRY